MSFKKNYLFQIIEDFKNYKETKEIETANALEVSNRKIAVTSQPLTYQLHLMNLFFSLHFQISINWAKSIVNQIKLIKFLSKLKCPDYKAKFYRSKYVEDISEIIFMTISEEIWEKMVNPADLEEFKETNKVFLSIEISIFFMISSVYFIIYFFCLTAYRPINKLLLLGGTVFLH